MFGLGIPELIIILFPALCVAILFIILNKTSKKK